MHIVDLEFGITGESIPADHGYALYGALSRILTFLHPEKVALRESSSNDLIRLLAIHPINGRLSGNRKLTISNNSRMRIRLPAEHIAEVLSLAGKKLQIDADTITLGIPAVRPLKAVPTLRCRLATIKGYKEPEPFLNAAQERLRTMQIQGEAQLIPITRNASLEGHSDSTTGRCPFIRRTIRISNREIVGYALRVTGLSAQESLDLQEQGLGGRRRMGCGIFVPEGS